MSRALTILTLAALTACTGASPTPQATEGPGSDARDMLVYAAAGDFANLLGVVSQSASDTMVTGMVYYPGLEAEFDCSLKYQPALYTSWSWSPDNLELTLTMRDDITWADGTTVTTADAAFAYELIADKTVASPRFNYTEAFAAPPQVISPTEIKFTYKVPGDPYTRLSQAAGYYVPKHLLQSADRATLRSHGLNRNPVPTGPYKLTDHKPNESFILEPNERFTGPKQDHARIKRVQFTIVPEYQTRLLKLKRGEVDLMENLQIKDYEALRKSNPNLRFERRGYRFMDYIGWNLTDPRFQDKAVRRAMAHAVDVDALIKRLLTASDGETFGRPAIGTITPEICAVRPDVQRIEKNLDEARRILAEAGWADTDGDGILDKDGVKLEFSLITNRENERRTEAAQVVQASLKEIGIAMKIDLLEFNAMSERLRRKDFQAALGGWAAGLFIDPSAFWHSGDEYPFNYGSYSNPEVDALIDRGLKTPDPAEAAEIWKEMQQKIYEDQPYLFLWWQDSIVAIDDRFQNTSIDILSLMHRIERWEVPADRVKYNF